MSAILVRFHYSHGLWHDMCVHRHRFSGIPIHLKCSQFLKIGFPQHPSLNPVGWTMFPVPIQVKHHILEPTLCSLLYLRLATICAVGLPWAPFVTGALHFTIGGHIKLLKTHAELQWHSCKTILAKNTDIINQQTGDTQLATCVIIHRGSTNSAVSWKAYALWMSLKWEC